MPLSWQDCSEIVCGKVIKGQYSINAVRPDIFFPPYCDIIKAIKTGTTEVEDLIEIIGLSPVQAALDSIRDINGLGDANWVSLLEKTYASYDAGQKLEKAGRKLQRGEEIDWAIIKQYEQRALEGIGGDFVPLSNVQGGEVPFIETGWEALDTHLGGIPSVGLIVVGGNPGIGKTTFMLKLASKFAEKHANKNVAIFTLEMVLGEIAMRMREVEKLSANVESRILLNDYPVSPEEAINKAATIGDLGLICIDFADLMIKGDNSESAMAHIYRTLMLGAKQLHCPIVLIAQLIKYTGGLPKPRHLRYTKLAEALAWMILMLYDPATDFQSEEKTNSELPILDNAAFILAWKVRGGFRKHLDEAPGAIQLNFRGDKGWGDKKSRWFSLKKVA